MHTKIMYMQIKRALSDPMHFVRKGFSLCSLRENKELLKPATTERSTRFVELDVSSDPKLT